MRTEFRAGLADVKRTTRRSRKHLEMGDLSYKLGYLWGWLTTPAPPERHPINWTIRRSRVDGKNYLVTKYDDGSTSSSRLNNNTPEV